MPTAKCNVTGFEDVEITYPDDWQLRHVDQFYTGMTLAHEGSSWWMKEVFAAVSLCESIEGLDVIVDPLADGDGTPLAQLPLSMFPVLDWLKTAVLASYYEASTPSKN